MAAGCQKKQICTGFSIACQKDDVLIVFILEEATKGWGINDEIRSQGQNLLFIQKSYVLHDPGERFRAVDLVNGLGRNEIGQHRQVGLQTARDMDGADSCPAYKKDEPSNHRDAVNQLEPVLIGSQYDRHLLHRVRSKKVMGPLAAKALPHRRMLMRPINNVLRRSLMGTL
jgi:hypothetical protein